jgi:hypothetical protein
LARLDYVGTYTRAPSIPSPAFPTRTEVWLPLVEVALLRPGGNGSGLSTWAVLDTGAGLNLFRASYADGLGLDWASAPTAPITGISGVPADAHFLSVEMVLVDANYRWNANIGFMPALTWPLLGHEGFFEHFEVRFRAAQRHFRIHIK